jgi:acyl carrier protein
MDTEFRHKLRDFIVETFLFGEGGDDLLDEDSLLERGIIDSTGVLEVTAFLEDDFGIKVGDEDLVPDNFDSIARLATFVQSKRSA